MGNVKTATANISLEDSGGSYWSESLPTGVIFSTNFDNDTAWTDVTPNGNFTNQNTPSNWTGMQRTTGGEFEVRVGGGQNGSNAMRFNYSMTVSLPSMTLFKHLTNRKARGYGRLYLRWNVRLGNNFRASDGQGGLDFWKWCRLLQNVDPNDFNTWSENRVDSHFIVCTWAGSQQWGADMNIVAGSNEGENLASGSAGGNHILLDWYQTGTSHIPHKDKFGHFQRMGGGDWELDTDGSFVNDTSQDWHTLEIMIQAASSPTANNGVVKMWFDGEDQGDYVREKAYFGAELGGGLPTAVMGSGWNSVHCFDNISGWQDLWGEEGVDGYVELSDFVVSTERIGHDHVAANVDVTSS